MNSTRLPNLSGNWVGHDQQLYLGKPQIARIHCRFEQTDRIIMGNIHFTPEFNDSPYSDAPTPFEAELRGEWFQGKVLKLDWYRTDDSILFCGCAIMELSHNGEKLSGSFVGFGPKSHAIVQGEILLAKKSIA